MSINPFCAIAAEEALRLKEASAADEVVAVTIGPKQVWVVPVEWRWYFSTWVCLGVPLLQPRHHAYASDIVVGPHRAGC